MAVLARKMPWEQIEQSLAGVFARKDRSGRQMAGLDLFDATLAVVGGGVSHAGRPRLPIRLMVAFLYLKYAHNLSDDAMIERWAQEPPPVQTRMPGGVAGVPPAIGHPMPMCGSV